MHDVCLLELQLPPPQRTSLKSLGHMVGQVARGKSDKRDKRDKSKPGKHIRRDGSAGRHIQVFLKCSRRHCPFTEPCGHRKSQALPAPPNVSFVIYPPASPGSASAVDCVLTAVISKWGVSVPFRFSSFLVLPGTLPLSADGSHDGVLLLCTPLSDHCCSRCAAAHSSSL